MNRSYHLYRRVAAIVLAIITIYALAIVAGDWLIAPLSSATPGRR